MPARHCDTSAYGENASDGLFLRPKLKFNEPGSFGYDGYFLDPIPGTLPPVLLILNSVAFE